MNISRNSRNSRKSKKKQEEYAVSFVIQKFIFRIFFHYVAAIHLFSIDNLKRRFFILLYIIPLDFKRIIFIFFSWFSTQKQNKTYKKKKETLMNFFYFILNLFCILNFYLKQLYLCSSFFCCQIIKR